MNRQPDIREYLAAERTFLAYIRTGLALMGLGFVVARFSLFVREFHALNMNLAPDKPGLSLWVGTMLIASGVALNCASTFEYRKLIQRLNETHSANWRPAGIPIATALSVAVCGVLITVYLISLR